MDIQNMHFNALIEKFENKNQTEYKITVKLQLICHTSYTNLKTSHSTCNEADLRRDYSMWYTNVSLRLKNHHSVQ